LNNSQDMSSLK